MPINPSLSPSLRLSIVIPALNEARGIAAALTQVRALAPEAELIVADGGSTDATREIAAPLAEVIEARKGRANQMNTGAAAAHGDWLLFLHADTRLPAGFLDEIARANALGFEAGAFQLRIGGRHPFLPVLAWGANLRSRWRKLAFGDQALFSKTTLFQRLDGFPPLPLMEDYAWCLRLRRERIPLYLSQLAVETSGRRWDELGFFRTWWTMRRLIWSFRPGGDPARRPQGYPDVR
jgi:rSAM/selenodomain-associated transferase 2